MEIEIRGYHQLTSDEIKLINEIKSHADAVGALVRRLDTTNSLDKRWVAIGKTDLQRGFMSLVRSVAQPTSF